MDQATVEALFSAVIVIATMLLVGFPVHEFLHAWTGENPLLLMRTMHCSPFAVRLPIPASS